MKEKMCLSLPDCELSIHPGNHVRLGRFEHEIFTVGYGWYAWGGNRPVCGWYLTGVTTKNVKPLQLTDLDDIYVVETDSETE